jgi:hypothetical protein
LITDEMLDPFALGGSWAELPKKVLKKYDGYWIARAITFRLHQARTKRDGARRLPVSKVDSYLSFFGARP